MMHKFLLHQGPTKVSDITLVDGIDPDKMSFTEICNHLTALGLIRIEHGIATAVPIQR